MTLTHLQHLEAESINIMREVVAEAEKPVMLYSIGNDSSVMLRLAMKAFHPAKPPLPLLHVDTTTALGHHDRHAPLRAYVTGLCLRGSARASSRWPHGWNHGMSGAVAAWIVDDTAFPKKGQHSVGVARQYCGVLGKQDNCQVAVSVSVAHEAVSLPVSYQLYLPESWARDRRPVGPWACRRRWRSSRSGPGPSSSRTLHAVTAVRPVRDDFTDTLLDVSVREVTRSVREAVSG